MLVFFFDRINFKHIYREFNVDADKMSKDAISMEEGILTYQFFKLNKSFFQGRMKVL